MMDRLVIDLGAAALARTHSSKAEISLERIWPRDSNRDSIQRSMMILDTSPRTRPVSSLPRPTRQ